MFMPGHKQGSISEDFFNEKIDTSTGTIKLHAPTPAMLDYFGTQALMPGKIDAREGPGCYKQTHL